MIYYYVVQDYHFDVIEAESLLALIRKIKRFYPKLKIKKNQIKKYGKQ
jgi:hypothetical protein